jgi:hypothetical protein
MALGEDLKEQFRPFFGKGDVAHLVNNQKTIAAIKLNETADMLLRVGFNQFIDKGTAGHKGVRTPTLQAAIPRAVTKCVLPVSLVPVVIRLRCFLTDPLFQPRILTVLVKSILQCCFSSGTDLLAVSIAINKWSHVVATQLLLVRNGHSLGEFG